METLRAVRGAFPHVVESGEARRVVEESGDAQQCVVTGGAGAGEGLGELLVGFENLLDDDPSAIRRVVQILHVVPRVGEAVDVVDAEALDQPLVVQIQQEAMRCLEHGRILDPNSSERVDVEEATVVEFLGADLPVRQAVPLVVEEFGDVHVLCAGTDREDLIEVDDDGLLRFPVGAWHRASLDGDVAGGHFLADLVAEHRHQDRLVGGEVHVEPVRKLGIGAVAHDLPQGVVVPQRSRHGHVVGDDVDDQPEPMLFGCLRETAEPVDSTHLLGDAVVVDDVVAVRRAGGRLQDGGAEDVRDTQRSDVWHLGCGVIEGEGGIELETVGRSRSNHGGHITRSRVQPVARPRNLKTRRSFCEMTQIGPNFETSVEF